MREPDPPEPLRGRHVLIVEDELLVALELEDVLRQAGAVPVGPALTLQQGLSLAESDPLDAALLDINLGTHQSFSIAYRLLERGVPAVFVTAYANYILPAKLQGAPILGKPCPPALVCETLARLPRPPG